MARPLTAPIREQLCLAEDVAKRVDDYRFDQRLASKSAALRELVELGLKAHEAKLKRMVERKARR